ncbi:MAG: PDZ domain-containing protein [Pirellulales bacterium]|nr:PDZ domain-containing protein [Pirellulales bacterium]
MFAPIRTFLALGLIAALLGGRARCEETASPAADADVAAWIEALDDERFAVRELAQSRLEALGPAALPTVAAAAKDPSLERATRAVRILLSWSKTGDPDKRLTILESLAAVADTHPSEASFAVEQLAAVREDAALAAIVELGGIANDQRGTAFGRGNQGPVQVVIGPKWTGGDEGLKHLVDVRRLQTLSFHSAPVGDDALLFAKQLPNLTRVEVYGTPHSETTLAALRAARPGLDVAVRSSGAQLGIMGDPNQPVAYVQQVGPDTAAERAGIRAGDVIAEINGEQVGNFEALTARIATFNPGESVQMKIIRAGQELELPVTFDRWGENENFTKHFSAQGGGSIQVNMNGTIIRGNGRIIIQNNAGPIVVPPPQQPAPKAR